MKISQEREHRVFFTFPTNLKLLDFGILYIRILCIIIRNNISNLRSEKYVLQTCQNISFWFFSLKNILPALKGEVRKLTCVLAKTRKPYTS